MAKRHSNPEPTLRFMHQQEFDDEAALLLAEYGREQGVVTAPPIPIDEIVEEHFKIVVEIRDLRAEFMGDGNKRGKSLTIRISPRSCSLKAEDDEELHAVGDRCLRRWERQKRANGFQTVSLDAAASDGDSKQPLSAQLTEDDLCRRTGNEPRDERVVLERERAVASALAEMPPDVRDVCRRVMGGSISSASRDLETSRRQIRKVLNTARQFVEKTGI